MKNEKYRSYICWGVTALVVLGLLITLVFAMINWNRVKANAALICGVLAPVIYGAVLAYLLTPIYNRVFRWVKKGMGEKYFSEDTRSRAGKLAATIFSVVFLTAIVIGLFSLLIPQLLESIRSIMEVLPVALPGTIQNFENWLEQLFADNPDMERAVMGYYESVSLDIQNWITNDLVAKVYKLIGEVSAQLFSVVNAVKNMLIGLIVMVYLLNMKEKLLTQAKMIIYGVLPLKIANKVIEEGRYVHQVFGGFIIGKLLDSLIIGILCFFIFSVTRMPFVLLISVIIGVTNVIPFFGPFIGAIPSAFFILLVSPIRCLYFIPLIFLIQQLDGNIIGPKILGNSTGLSSFWVLFSILLFGGVFGFVGMIIGVPTFAVIYRLIMEFVTYRLKKKELSGDITKYEQLNYIDEGEKTYIKK